MAAMAACQCAASAIAVVAGSSVALSGKSGALSSSLSGVRSFASASSSSSCCSNNALQQQLNSAGSFGNFGTSSGRRSLPCPRADLDSDTILAVGVGIAGIALGIGIPVFYETQVKGSEQRENDQPCFPCKGTGSQTCRFCIGAGNITVELGGGDREVSKCINCEGAGSITCTTCQGSGVQPRYLDRREYKDED